LVTPTQQRIETNIGITIERLGAGALLLPEAAGAMSRVTFFVPLAALLKERLPAFGPPCGRFRLVLALVESAEDDAGGASMGR